MPRQKKNNTIKFSHHYFKFGYPACNSGILLEVFKTNSEDLCKQFVEFDAIYHADTDEAVKFYPLPKGEVLVLLFESNSGYNPNYGVWTTVRRYTPEKEAYYKARRGQKFDVIINEKEDAQT